MIHRIGRYAGAFHASRHRDFRGISAPAKPDGGSVEERASEVRSLLQNGGPVYSSFALYLSSRVDLLPAGYCRELALTPDVAPALPPEEVDRIMFEELGATFHRLFREFKFIPIRLGLMGQTHAAELTNSDAVTVFILRPEYAGVTSTDQIAEYLSRIPIHDLCSSCIKEEVVADFGAALRRATDLRLRAQTMEVMAPNEGEAGTAPVRRVYGELSGARVLTTSCEDDTCLEQALGASERDLQTLARTVCQRWLRESLYGRFCPVDPRAGNIARAAHSGIHFGGNEFVELPKRTKLNLQRYLHATLDDDPDQAARYLLQEMLPPKGGLREAGEFRSKFRQSAYFGALEPVLGTNTNALAQLIFQHWKTALGHGYVPTPNLLCFYRGLFSIARVARKLAPAEDPLREGLEELNAITKVNQFNEIASASYWWQNADKYAMAVINFPRAVDDLLSQAARPNLGRWSESAGKASSSGPRSFLAGAALMLAVIIFLLQGDANTWMEKSAVLALMIAGLTGLRALDD